MRLTASRILVFLIAVVGLTVLISRSNNGQSTAKKILIIGSYNVLSQKIFVRVLWTLCVPSCGPAAIAFRFEAQTESGSHTSSIDGTWRIKTNDELDK
jgi:hypothetical protein